MAGERSGKREYKVYPDAAGRGEKRMYDVILHITRQEPDHSLVDPGRLETAAYLSYQLEWYLEAPDAFWSIAERYRHELHLNSIPGIKPNASMSTAGVFGALFSSLIECLRAEVQLERSYREYVSLIRRLEQGESGQYAIHLSPMDVQTDLADYGDEYTR